MTLATDNTDWRGLPEALRNEIVVGDALEYLRALPAGCVPMFLFSPPYNLNRRADGRDNASAYLHSGITRHEPLVARRKRLAPPAPPLGHYPDTTAYGQRGGAGKWQNGIAYQGYQDAVPWAEYTRWQEDILAASWRALADDGAIYYVHKPRSQDGVTRLPTEYGRNLTLRQVVIWLRAGGVNMAPTHYMPTCEWVCIFAKPGFRLRDKSASGVGDVWRIPQEINTWHPAPFPEALAIRALETAAPAFVVDPFAGSGTTCVAAKALGIGYAGNDMCAVYVERARARVADAQPPLFTAAEHEQGDMFAGIEAQP